MNNELSGTRGSSPIFSTEFASAKSDSATTRSATDIEMQVYGGPDTIGQIAFVPQDFLIKSKTIYDVSASNPMLLQPDFEGETGPAPYGTAERRLILHTFSRRVLELMKKRGVESDEKARAVLEFLIKGKMPSDSQLADLAKEIGKQAKEEIREQARLPQSWDPSSASPKDWIPTSVLPYSEEKQVEINQYYEKEVEKAVSESIEKGNLTQQQVGQLRSALSTGKVPSAIAEAFDAITKKASEATQKTYGLSETWFKGTDNLDEWKPINLGIVTPMKANKARCDLILANVFDLAKNYASGAQELAESLAPDDPKQQNVADFYKVISRAIQQLKATLREIQLTDAEKSKDAYTAKMEAIEARTAKRQEELDKQKEIREKQKEAEKTQKIMKIVGPIIGVLTTVVAVAITIASLGTLTAVGVALAVAGIAVSVAFTTYSIVDSYTGTTQKLMGEVNKLLESIPGGEENKDLYRCLTAALVVVVLIAVIVFSKGTMVTSVSGVIVKETVKQLATQAVVMAVMVSLPQVTDTTLKACGVNEKDSKIASAIITAVAILVMIVAMAVAKKGGSTQTAAEQKVLSQELSESTKRVIANAQKFLPETETLFRVQKVLTSTQLLGNTMTGITVGILGLQVSKLLNEVGDTQKAEELLQALIQMLEKLLKSIQSGIDNAGDFSVSLQHSLNSFWDIQSGQTSKITRALQA